MNLSCLSHVKRSGSTRPDASPLYSDTVFHGDNSGSMSSMGYTPSAGAIKFGKEYKKLGKGAAHACHLTFGVFSTLYFKVFSGNPGNLTDAIIVKFGTAMRPTNSTCFYDTTIQQLRLQRQRVRKQYAALPKKVRQLVNLRDFASVVFTIMTDGDDKMSIRHDHISLRKHLAKHQDEYGAKVMFIAANMSAEQVGDKYGIPKGNCLQMGSDPHYAGIAMTNLTRACLRSSQTPSSGSLPPPPAFTLLQQTSSCSYNEYSQYNLAPPPPSHFSLPPPPSHFSLPPPPPPPPAHLLRR